MTDIKQQQWIHIHMGNDTISKEEWEPIKNSNYQNKPTGGLWLSKYSGEDYNICEWLNYVQDQIAENGEYSKLYRHANSYKGGFIIELEDHIRIAEIKTEEDLRKFIEKFSLSDKSLDYEKMAEEYDALHLQMFHLPMKYWSESTLSDFHFKSWGCNTLLIFRYEAIKTYSKIELDTLFDSSRFISFKIKREKVYRKDNHERKGIC